MHFILLSNNDLDYLFDQDGEREYIKFFTKKDPRRTSEIFKRLVENSRTLKN